MGWMIIFRKKVRSIAFLYLSLALKWASSLKQKKLKETLSNVESDLEEEEYKYEEEEEEPEEKDDRPNKHTYYSHLRKFDQFIFIIYRFCI